ncbi:hypothetical protein PAMP_006403 [Pampus punctatissimus]
MWSAGYITKSGIALLYNEETNNTYDVCLKLTKEVLTIQKLDVVCTRGSESQVNGGAEHNVPVVISKIFKDQVHLLRTAGDEVTITVRYLREVPSFLKLPLGTRSDENMDSKSIHVVQVKGEKQGSPGPPSNDHSRVSSPLFDSGFHLNGNGNNTAPSPPSPSANEPKYEKRWLDAVSLPLLMARVSRYKAGTDKLRSNCFEVFALDGASTNILQFCTAAESTDWLQAISTNINDLTLENIKIVNKYCSSDDQIVHMGWASESTQGSAAGQTSIFKFLALRGPYFYIFRSPPISATDWGQAETTYNLYEVLFKVHKLWMAEDCWLQARLYLGLEHSPEQQDNESLCFSILVGHGQSHTFRVELATDLAIWEKSFQRAVFLEVQRIRLVLHDGWKHGAQQDDKEDQEQTFQCKIGNLYTGEKSRRKSQTHSELVGAVGSKSYMCSSQGSVLCFTIDFGSGFTCSEGASKTVLWRYKFSQLKGSSDDGKTRVKLLFKNAESKQIEMKNCMKNDRQFYRQLRGKNEARQSLHIAELLSWEDVELIAELSQCPPPTYPSICQHSHHSKYRSISGLCNNRQNPLWGAANTALVRWLPAEYEDAEREPKGWNRGRLHNGFQLPSPLEVSKKIMKSYFKRDDDAYSKMLVEWGQYIDHDVTFTPQSTGKHCMNTCENVHPCFPIKTDDMLSVTQPCMPFHRSTPACFVNFGSDIRQALQQQQMNAITSFIDASVVYGNTPTLESFLRDLSGFNGKLTVNNQFKDPKGRAYLPFVPTLPSSCHQDLRGERVECFHAGDSRVNEGMPLITIHTLWLREHNRIAEALKHLNDHWSPETVYQEARKIIGALHQIITMRDYVPKIIGPESFENYIGPYRGYDPTLDPSASNVFATAAFRFGHSTISPILMRLNESFQEHEHIPHLRLRNTFFSPWRIVKEGGIEPVLRGVIGTAAAAVSADMLMTEEVTENLVVLKNAQFMDLASVNLQRGRDHALPGNNALIQRGIKN